MQNTKTSKPLSARLQILVQVLLAIGASIPGAMLVLMLDGSLLGLPIRHLRDSPFKDFLFPGLILFVFIGVYPSAVAYGLWKKPRWSLPDLINPFKRIHWAWAASLAAGVILIIWITVEVVMIRSFDYPHYIYIGWCLALIFLTLLPNVRQYYARQSN